MRTRKVQVNELAYLLDGVQATDVTKRILECNLIEAEARGAASLKSSTHKAQADERPDIRQWQADQQEWFDPTVRSIVAEYAAWRDQQDHFQSQEKERLSKEGNPLNGISCLTSREEKSS